MVIHAINATKEEIGRALTAEAQPYPRRAFIKKKVSDLLYYNHAFSLRVKVAPATHYDKTLKILKIEKNVKPCETELKIEGES